MTTKNRRVKGFNENEFLLVIQNALSDEACFYWCHVFGNDKKDEHLHYSHLSNLINIEGFSKNDVNDRLIDAIQHTEAQYGEFRKNMIDVRNKCLAHKAISKTRYFDDIEEEDIGDIDYLYPNLLICKKMCEEFLKIICEIINKLINGNYSYNNNDNYYRTLNSMLYVISQRGRRIDENCKKQYNEIIQNQ